MLHRQWDAKKIFKLASVLSLSFNLLSVVGPVSASELDDEIGGLQVEISHRHEQPRSLKPVAKNLGDQTPAGTQLPSLDQLKPGPDHDNSGDFESLDLAQAPAKKSGKTKKQKSVVRVVRVEHTKESRVEHPTARGTTPTTTVANSPKATVVESSSASTPTYTSLRTSYEAPTRRGGGFIYSVSVLPMAGISTFDGGDRSSNNIMPVGNNNTSEGYFNFPSFSGSVVADLNLLGSKHWLIEAGAAFLQTGSTLGTAPYGQYGYIYNDSIKLNYLGVPVLAKWLASGIGHSSFYVRGGVVPAYLMSHQYSYSGNFSNYSNEYRFGGYSSWDLLATVGAGYTFTVSRHFDILVDVSGFQGVIPVFQAYSVMNVGGSAGLGLSYVL